MKYIQYYTNQNGGGLADIGAIYHARRVQHGHGIGNIFGGLMKYLKPLVSSGLSALKDQSLKTGRAIIRDLGNKPLNHILREQTVNAAQGLADKAVNKLKRKFEQNGSGGSSRKKRKLAIKRVKAGKKKHSTSRQLKSKDIFSK